MSVDHYAFASDNAAGICPEAWCVLEEANARHVGSYGDDPFTEEACQHLRELFGIEAEVFFVYNGTAANSLALASICRSFHAIVAHEKAHIVTDECGAPEHFTGGSKILGGSGAEAKLTVDEIERVVSQRRDLHFPKPRALSLTQATEFGTVYSVEEIRTLTDCASSHGLGVHLDGARFANAVVSLGVSPAELTWKVGIDVMSFGLTKLGAGVGEAVVFFDRSLAEEFDYRCKQAGQLASKMRFLSASWCGLLRDQKWLSIAARANAQAKALRAGLAEIPGVELLFPTQANAVFARFPQSINDAMHAKGWHYYELAGVGDSRLMCSWATRDEDIAAFLSDLAGV
mgnify:CR=1 FL=1